MGTLVGTILGLSAAALVGWLIFASAVRLNLRLFFNVTSVMLLFFAAGLFGLAVHEFQEAGLLPMTIEQVWNLNAVINEDSPIGLVLKALFGYNGNPSLLEVLGYVAYWVLALVGVRWWVNRRTAQADAGAPRPDAAVQLPDHEEDTRKGVFLLPRRQRAYNSSMRLPRQATPVTGPGSMPSCASRALKAGRRAAGVISQAAALGLPRFHRPAAPITARFGGRRPARGRSPGRLGRRCARAAG